MKALKPIGKKDWRERRPDEDLPDLDTTTGIRHGRWRCRATHLWHGDCEQPRLFNGSYCYYHDKLRLGLTTPSADLYPVYPLPDHGYVIKPS